MRKDDQEIFEEEMAKKRERQTQKDEQIATVRKNQRIQAKK